MRIDILTLFPGFFKSPFATSLISKAIAKKILGIRIHDIRKAGVGTHRQVDDRPFGGGPGMVLKPDVLAASLKNAAEDKTAKDTPYVILLDPAGTPFNQEVAKKLSQRKRLVLICGHYEGVDERFKEFFVDEEISIGDYILSGGETAALVVVDAISRLIPGFLGKEESAVFESFSKHKVSGKEICLLDYPVYTRPEIFAGKKVPKTLLSGNHAAIEKWRLTAAIEKTKNKRPDLLRKQRTDSR